VYETLRRCSFDCTVPPWRYTPLPQTDSVVQFIGTCQAIISGMAPYVLAVELVLLNQDVGVDESSRAQQSLHMNGEFTDWLEAKTSDSSSLGPSNPPPPVA
jgi:hypothetical protein